VSAAPGALSLSLSALPLPVEYIFYTRVTPLCDQRVASTYSVKYVKIEKAVYRLNCICVYARAYTCLRGGSRLFVFNLHVLHDPPG